MDRCMGFYSSTAAEAAAAVATAAAYMTMFPSRSGLVCRPRRWNRGPVDNATTLN